MATTLLLHIDDRPELPEGFAEALQGEGYELLRTADPEEAIRLLEEEPALVLMELELAGCDGLDLLAGIRAQAAGVPVLVLTRAPRDSGLYGEAIAAGVSDFLTKPVPAPQLLASIRESAPKPAPEPAPEPVVEPSVAGEAIGKPLPEVLARLHRHGATGVLFAVRGDAQRAVQFRNGYPVAVSSNEVDDSRREDPARTEEEIALEVERRAESALLEAFRWADASLHFVDGRRLESDTVLDLARDPSTLILAGVLEASPLEPIIDWLVKHASLYVSAVAQKDGTLEDLELTAAQERRLVDLEGEERLADVLDSGVFEERLLYGLWVVGRLELHAAPTLALLDEICADVEEVEGELATTGERALPSVDEPGALLHTLRELAQRVMTVDDFEALDVPVFAPDGQVQTAYEERLREIPEEGLTNEDPQLRARAQRIRDRIEAAYQNLKDPETRRAYALLRSEQDQEPDAKPSAARALEAERWFRKGGQLLVRKRFREASEAFGMASHLDPNEGEYLSHLGYALYLSNPNQEVVQREAMEHIANGIKRSPARELSYIFLGRILRMKGELDTARKVFRRALKIKPDCHAALQELRLLELREKKSKGILARLWRR